MYRLYRLWDNIKRLPWNIRRGVKNLVYWLPIIWNDRPWDQVYFFKILAHKLLSIEHGLDREDSEIANVRMARIAIERLRDEEYEKKVFAIHDEKWGELKMNGVWNDDHTSTRLVFSRPKTLTSKEVERERKEYRVAVKHTQYLQQQDLDCFADIFRKHVLKWWD